MPEFEDMDAATLRDVLMLVREHTGIDMVEAKRTMLQARLRPRMRSLKLGSYAAYVRRLKDDPGEQQRFIDVVTTHQTSFFRTPKVWQHVREQFLPAWAARHPGRPLRVWSAAVSTGEEACTIAICCEELRRQQPAFDYEIVGTDISTDVVAQAQAGRYEGSAVEAFQAADPQLFERYNAAGTSTQFMLPAAVRGRMTFSAHNLLLPPPWQSAFDVVFLRNVLIYFNTADSLRIVRHIAPALREKGVLVIGESESLASADVPFQFVRPQVYERTGG